MTPQTGSPQSPQIAPPVGYREVGPLLKTHRLALPKAGEVPQFLRQANAVPISHAEFPIAVRTYPIVFTTGDEGKTYSAVAVLGEPVGPSDEDVKQAMYGNICRCGAYPNIVAAVQAVRRNA